MGSRVAVGRGVLVGVGGAAVLVAAALVGAIVLVAVTLVGAIALVAAASSELSSLPQPATVIASTTSDHTAVNGFPPHTGVSLYPTTASPPTAC